MVGGTIKHDYFIPQPNIGSPGIGDLTRAFLGDAGVTGLLDMVHLERQREINGDFLTVSSMLLLQCLLTNGSATAKILAKTKMSIQLLAQAAYLLQSCAWANRKSPICAGKVAVPFSNLQFIVACVSVP